MTIVTHNSEKEKPGEVFAALLVGKEQAGKSFLAATAPDPVLFIDTDRKAYSLAGRKGVFAITVTDPGNTLMQPTGFAEIQGLIAKLEQSRSLRQFNPEWPDVPVSTLVFDSIQTLCNMARNYVLYSNKDLAYAVSIAGQQYRAPKTWHGWEVEKGMVEALILQARSIPQLNVICTLHEAMEEDERSTSENPIYTGRIEVYPVRYRILLKYFTEVWRLVRQGAGAPTLYAQPDGNFLKAGNSLNILQPVQNPNIKELIAKSRNGSR